MKYFKTNDYLIRFNPETNVYRIANFIGLDKKILSKEEFDTLNPISIKKAVFDRLVNQYFKSTKHSWLYNNYKYRKLDNFEVDRYGRCSNYDLVKIPKHNLQPEKSYSYLNNMLFVYYRGKVYYFMFYNGDIQGQLIDIITNKNVQWTSLKNCAPVFNTETKEIV